jgi:hypothetical protein
VTAFFVLYALTITIELVLSLVMAVFLFLILAPTGKIADQPQPASPSRRYLARSVEGALGDAFAAVSEGRDDLATITNARSLLARHAREYHDRRAG